MNNKPAQPDPFHLDIDEKVTFFIEGANLHALSKNLDLPIDFAKLLAYFKNNCRFIRGNFYTAVNEEVEYNSIRPLVDWLAYNGYNVFTKPSKEFTDSLGRRKVKGNCDIEMTVDMLEAAKTCDHIVLFSGDGEFTAVLAAIQRLGVRTTIVSSISSASDELRRRTDNFVDLEKVRSLIGKTPDPRAAASRGPARVAG